MYGSRDEIRQVYLQVWNKMQDGSVLEPMEAMIAEIIEMHSEYHGLLQQGESATDTEFTPEMGQTNPFLHMGMHIALREQASTNRPAGINEIRSRLSAKMGVHAAEHAMMECLGQALWQAQRSGSAPDEQAYLECLQKL